MSNSWESLETRYKGNIEQGLDMTAMLKFVQEIANSTHKDSLYAWTSMHDLCIAQKPEQPPYSVTYLRVSPKFNGQIEFRYMDSVIKSKQWVRIVDDTEAFKRLEGLIDQLHWVVKVKRHGEA